MSQQRREIAFHVVIFLLHLSIVACLLCPIFPFLSFIPICSNVPFPNPLKCILLVSLLNRRRLLSISLTNETPICPYPLRHVSCQFPYPQFWPFLFVPCQLQTVMFCPCPCLKCACPKCDVLCFVLYTAQSLSKICPVQCVLYISLSGPVNIALLIYLLTFIPFILNISLLTLFMPFCPWPQSC